MGDFARGVTFKSLKYMEVLLKSHCNTERDINCKLMKNTQRRIWTRFGQRVYHSERKRIVLGLNLDWIWTLFGLDSNPINRSRLRKESDCTQSNVN